MTGFRRSDLVALLICLGLALAVRLPGLDAFLTADEARSWFGRSIIFLDSLTRGDWANTGPGGAVSYIENVSLSPAPGVTTMWSGALGIMLTYWRWGSPGDLARFLQTIPFDPLDPATLPWLRLPGVLVAVAAVGLTYWWSRPLIGRWPAFLAAALLALDPFSLALSRILGHDALVAAFMWLSLLAFLRALPSPKLSELNPATVHYSTEDASLETGRRLPFTIHHSSFTIHNYLFLLLSGAFAGLAFLSKYPALFLGAFAGLAMLVSYWRRPPADPAAAGGLAARYGARLKAVLPAWFSHMLIWSAAAGLVFVLLWPAMWINPLEPVTTILQDAMRASGGAHQKGSFFLGQPVPDPGPLFYPLVALLRATPIILLGLLLSLWGMANWGMASWRTANERTASGSRSAADKNPAVQNTEHTTSSTEHAARSMQYASRVTRHVSRFTPFLLWSYVILYTLLVTYGGKKQDRYLLPAFPALVMLAAIGYGALWNALTGQTSRFTLRASRRPLRLARLAPVLLAVLLLLQAVFVLPTYPYYLSYYNPLLGGARTAAGAIQVGWGEGLNEAAAYLNTRPGIESEEAVSWYSTTFEPYFEGQTIYKIEEEKISRSAKPGLAADYVIFYINQVQRLLPSEGGLAYFRRNGPLHTVSLAGQPYAWIYPAPGVSHIIPGEARLVGQAELLGFDLLDGTGGRLATAPSGSAPTLRLYWEWQGNSPNEPIRLSLVDDAGGTWGWGHLLGSNCPAGDCTLEGTVMVNEYALAIYPGTPPGRYFLQAWIDRPDTGEVVGRFPLAPTDAPLIVSLPAEPVPPEEFEIEHRLDAGFDPLRLLGYNLSPEPWQPGEQRRLELFWSLPGRDTAAQVEAGATDPALAESAALSLTPVKPASLPAAVSHTWQRPIIPAYPPSRWQPGDIFRDLWTLTLPPTTPRGQYDLNLTLNGVDQIIGRVNVGGRERLFDPPPISYPLAATLGNDITLLGYDLTSNLQLPTSNLQPPTSNLHLTLYWQAQTTPPDDYTVFVQLLDANQQVVAQQDSQPQAGAAPTGTWTPGEIVSDSYTLSFEPPPPGQPYRLIAGMYRPNTGERLPIVTPEGQSDALILTVIDLDG